MPVLYRVKINSIQYKKYMSISMSTVGCLVFNSYQLALECTEDYWTDMSEEERDSKCVTIESGYASSPAELEKRENLELKASFMRYKGRDYLLEDGMQMKHVYHLDRIMNEIEEGEEFESADIDEDRWRGCVNGYLIRFNVDADVLEDSGNILPVGIIKAREYED